MGASVPHIPAPIPPPAPPSPAEISAKLDKANQEQAKAMSGGMTSTMLTGGGGVDEKGKTAKILLGR